MSKGGSAPQAPKPKTIDIGQMMQRGIDADKRGFAISDQDWRKRFPLLAKGDRANITDASNQLGGRLPRQTTLALDRAGLGREGTEMNTGNEFSTARNMGEPILAKEQRDRNYFENELASPLHQPRKFGPGGTGALKMLEANTGMANQYAQAGYGTQLQDYTSSLAQQAQNFAALGNIATGVTRDVMAFNQPNPYLNPFAGGAYTPTSYAPGGEPVYDSIPVDSVSGDVSMFG